MIQFDDQLSTLRLSAREHQVLKLVASGMSSKQIAQGVGITPRTVERHVENIRNKLRAKNKTHMIAIAMTYGLLHIGRGAAPGVDGSSAFRFQPRMVANEQPRVTRAGSDGAQVAAPGRRAVPLLSGLLALQPDGAVDTQNRRAIADARAIPPDRARRYCAGGTAITGCPPSWVTSFL